MDLSFWLERWRLNQIGFHQSQFNAHLQEFWQSLCVESAGSVFVPLCGKSLDMLWLLGQGHPVIGVEISPIAVSTFFSENSLKPERQVVGDFEKWKTDELCLLLGDFFSLASSDIATVKGVYDRASLIALPPEMRKKYALHLMAIIPPFAQILLVTVEYDQSEMSGPPFSVREEEVSALYGHRYDISLLYECDALAGNPQFSAKGVSQMKEKVYKMKPYGLYS